MNTPLWTPSAERIANANLTHYQQWLQQHFGLSLANYLELHTWSVQDRAAFWQSLWTYFGIHSHSPCETVLAEDHMPGARWFPGATINFAEHLLRYRDERVALVGRTEAGRRVSYSYAELYQEVAQLAATLRRLGVQRGNRVAGFLPNLPETVIAMLATTSLGAIWSSCSPDFGLQGVLDRFGQIEPKVLFCTDGYHYNGKPQDSLARVRSIVGELPTVANVIVIPLVNDTPALDGLPGALSWQAAHDTSAQDITFEPVPFDHPLYILYSSGTTGKPKCIVHGTGGALLQHLKELALHTDLKRDDTFFYYTTCGWMMWNWLVSGLALGATLVLYDGSPFHPAPTVLWDMVDAEGISIFGTSAKYIAALEKAGVKPRESHRLSRLRAILSTGSPLTHEGFDYVYRDIKADLCLSSISGGTDIVSCFALGNPVLPVWRGELQCRGLGMAVDVYNEQGQPVRGEKGELVCTHAFPSMPVAFWNDPDGSKYHKAYFARFPGIWAHGDYAELTEHDGMVIYGRSDAVLNPGGVRIGTAEIYRQVEQVPEVLESIAIGQNWDSDVRVVLFVRLRDGLTLDDALCARIRDTIRRHTTPRHVPAKIVQVPDIPRTISGKIVELAVRAVVHGQPVQNTEALANPEALAHFANRSELAQP